MKTVSNIESTAITAVAGDTDNIVTITFNSGKSYNYRDTTGSFVDMVESAVQNQQSVGRLFNRALKEDQTLQIVAVWPLNNTKPLKIGANWVKNGKEQS